MKAGDNVRKTKIVATVGPATREPEALRRLVKAGVDVVRVNFSHGEPEEHRQVIELVKQIREETGRPLAVLQDLPGPKIRTGTLREGAVVMLEDGQPVRVTTRDVPSDHNTISILYDRLCADVAPGGRILLDDGNIELRVERVESPELACTVVDGGALRERVGVNLPGASVSAQAFTARDKECLLFGLEQEVDYVALSFVRSAEDLRQAGAIIKARGATTSLIAKIERPEAVDNLESILEASDGVMVARGDLALETSIEEVPILQKRIIRTANRRFKTVITATQMLESMLYNARPTRAEASDVANAVVDGTDAVMLSGETAVGRYPAEAVRTMASIVRRSEEELVRSRDVPQIDAERGNRYAQAVVGAVAVAAADLRARAIAVFTQSGRTAQYVSNYRPSCPIYAFTPRSDTYRRMAMLWGVVPELIELGTDVNDLVRRGEAVLLAKGHAGVGETVIMVAGTTPLVGATNMMKIHRCGAAAG